MSNSIPRLHIPPESFLTDDRRPRKQIRKADATGFTPFHNLTIVAPEEGACIPDSLSARVHALIDSAHAALGLLPLPASSYHCTLSAVKALASCQSLDEYHRFSQVYRPHFERLKWQYAQVQECVRCTAVVGVVFDGVTLSLTPATDEDAAAWQRLVDMTAATLGPVYCAQHRMHMTLAYKRPGTVADREGLEQLRLWLQALIGTEQFVLRPPRVCVSPDMCTFTPV